LIEYNKKFLGRVSVSAERQCSGKYCLSEAGCVCK